MLLCRFLGFDLLASVCVHRKRDAVYLFLNNRLAIREKAKQKVEETMFSHLSTKESSCITASKAYA